MIESQLEEVRQQIEQLRETIRYHDRLYHLEARPEISDLEFDRLMSALQELEQRYPQLITPDSPTQRVGGAPVPELKSATHRLPMLSIENTYSEDEVRRYAERTARLLAEPIEWAVELKIDGVAVSLIYEAGRLTQALTRGDGFVGDDVTHNIRTINSVPLQLEGDAPRRVEIRGEVYMTNSDLVALNEQQQARGERPFANTRNVSAGSIRLLDPRQAAERPLRLFCHGVGYFEGLSASTHEEYLRLLQRWGLTPTPHVKVLPDIDSALDYCQTLIERLHAFDFEVDGIVLKVNRWDQRLRLGETAKHPRWLIAYKFEKYEASTRLHSIQVQVGKTGTVTPVALLEPVPLAGTIVSRASLHNAEEIERKDVREGDLVVVEKAGKIIPHIVRVEKHQRSADTVPYLFPQTCPACGARLVKDEGGVYIRCPNLECPAQLKERLRYFASRQAMNIQGLGDKLVSQLVEMELVKHFADLYQLSEPQLASLDRMGARSAQKLCEEIQASKQRGLTRLLNGLSIRHVGTTVARVLAGRFRTIEALQEASVEEVSQVQEIGEVIARSVYDFLHDDYGQRLIQQLRQAGVSMESTEPAAAAAGEGPLAGKTVVITGTLQNYSREEIKELVERLGGRAASSVSANTDLVVAGENAGSKLAKARQLNIPVLNETEFTTLAGGS